MAQDGSLAGPAWMKASLSLLPGALASTSHTGLRSETLGWGRKGELAPAGSGSWASFLESGDLMSPGQDSKGGPDSPSACSCQDGSCPQGGRLLAPFCSNQSVSVAIPASTQGRARWGGERGQRAWASGPSLTPEGDPPPLPLVRHCPGRWLFPHIHVYLQVAGGQGERHWHRGPAQLL